MILFIFIGYCTSDVVVFMSIVDCVRCVFNVVVCEAFVVVISV